MSKTIEKTRKIHSTVKIFLICFSVYFICNVYTK